MAVDRHDDVIHMPVWKSYLYHLQQQAPKPKRITCQRDATNKPHYYGREYHGAISREDADFLLTIGGEGSYLIRESQRAPGQYTLAIRTNQDCLSVDRFEGVTKNFKLYYDGQHYVGEKRFDTVHDLVADGLITFYLESKAADYIAALSSQSNYAESPYVAYNTQRKRQLNAVQGASSIARAQAQARTQQKSQPPPLPQPQPKGEPQPSTSAEGAGVLDTQDSRDSRDSQGSKESSGSHDSSEGKDPSEQKETRDANDKARDRLPRPIPIPAPRNKVNLPVEGGRLSQILETRKSAEPEQPPPPVEEAKENGKVSHSTNTDGPKSKSPVSTLVMDIEKQHRFSKMLEEPLFSTPPGSPPPSMHVLGYEKQHNFKVSSVSWCTDYMEVMGCEKPHNFKPHTFKGPHWCDFCANFLWGLIAQGVKCQDCGFNAHKKCSEKVPNDCMPDMKYVKRMFGIDLTTLVKAQNTLIPIVVEMCIKEIEARGVDAEGIYRVAGFHDDVEAIKMCFDKDGELTDISEERYEDINTITSVLKLYFRLLPIPLVTFDIYFRVMDAVKQENLLLDDRIEMLRHSLMQLPPAHYHTLKYLMSHLHRVTEHLKKNMMNCENLAIVFAPTLLRSPETDPLTSLTAVKFERELIELLIIHQTILFDQ